MALVTTKQMDDSKEAISLTIDDIDQGFEVIKNLAKAKARESCDDPMLLSWHSGITGDYWPKYECGAGGQSPWIVYSESRGCNLTVDVNDGDYTFYFLKI
jgi:hypothetical protein